MKRLIFLFLALVAIVVNAQEIATWEGFRKGAASFTFDAGAPSHIVDVGPMFEKYGYRATFYLVCNWNPDWIGFQGLADNGHEIGSNSKSHGMGMEGEEASSKAYLNSKITQEYGVLTAAYPNGNPPTDPTAMQENYIAGRLVSGDVMGKDGPTDWYKLPAIITGVTGSIQRAVDFTSKMQEAINKSGWVVFITHGLSGRNNGNATYSPTDPAALDGALKWANYNDYIWIAPLRSVVMYIRERKASTFKEVGSTYNTRTYTLTHNIANEVCQFNYPLSLCVPLPDGWGDAKVMQAGMELESEIKEDGKVYFKAVPNGGDIVMSETIHHNHNYTTWNYDAYTHWHVCTSTEGYCNAPKADEAAHSFGTGYICTVCGYEGLMEYGFSVYNTEVTSQNKNDILGNGVFSYLPETKTLLVRGNHLSPRYGNILVNESVEGLVVNISGNVTLSALTGFLSHSDMTITGPGHLTVSTQMTTTDMMDGSKLVIKDIAIDAECDKWGIAGEMAETLVIQNSTIKAKGPSGAICDFNGGITLTGCKIVKPIGGYVKNGDVVDASGNLATEVVIAKNGDANLDGVVDIADVVAVLNAMANDSNAPQFKVNDDNVVDIADVVAVLNIMAQQ